MSSLFSPNSKFSIFMTRVFDLFVLNMLFLLSSIPFVTIGTASTSVYYITLKMAAGTDTYIVKPYFKVFKENFKKSTIVWCITALIGVVLLMDFHLETYIPGTFKVDSALYICHHNGSICFLPDLCISADGKV